MSAKGQ